MTGYGKIWIIFIVIIGVFLYGCTGETRKKEENMNLNTKNALGGKSEERTVYFAGGCFWGVEGYFKKIPGVMDTEVGYSNGRTENPSYEDLVYRNSGHAETVKVVYDKNTVTLEELILHLFRIIDPFSVNRQGNDVGEQYRTGIYYSDEEDRERIETVMEKLSEKYKKEGENRPIAVEVKPLEQYTPAEEYHQDYLDKNPGGYCHINLNLADEPLFPRESELTETDEELKDRIGADAYRVARENGTERPHSSPLDKNFEPGIYVDKVSGEPLFTSTDKFDAGCGWPSFTKPITEDSVEYNEDSSHGMHRIEVRSRDSDSHLGHVFPDGPREEGGLRYCINGVGLEFIPLDEMEERGYEDYIPLVRE